MSSFIAGPGSGLKLQPPDASQGAAAFLIPQIAIARAECDDPLCLERHQRRGQSHGAFLYELRWGIVEHAGLLLTAVGVQTVCRQCGKHHEQIEVPRVARTARPESFAEPT